jgi:ubiquitin-protein ligase
MNPRLRRLLHDFESVRATFSGHPHVSVEPEPARHPPERYRVTYRVRGLALEGTQPVYRDEHVVDVMLPLHYPADKPYCVPVSPVFHPNVKDYFCIADHWAAGMSLIDVIFQIGDMIQWRAYNTRSPLDAVAARWANENEALFPIGDVELGVPEVDVAIKLR